MPFDRAIERWILSFSIYIMNSCRYSLEPEKVHPTVEFVIMEKFGGLVFCHLAPRLANVITQAGRQGGQAG